MLYIFEKRTHELNEGSGSFLNSLTPQIIIGSSIFFVDRVITVRATPCSCPQKNGQPL